MFVPDKDAFEKIISLGIDLECVEGKIGDNVVAFTKLCLQSNH